MVRLSKVTIIALVLLGLVPTTSFAQAQASIAGVVKDASGAVLPGVTVEASSPVLIEKVRSVVTDPSGQYKIVDLRPGTYSVSFTLTGFATTKRDGIELAGSFTATVNVEMKVGAIEETVTVTGESPVIDVQSTRQQRTIGHDVLDVIPTGRSPNTVGVLIPGVTATGGVGGGVTQDVGGALGDVMVQLAAHGGRPTDQRLNVDGLVQSNDAGNGSFTSFQPNLSATQEVTFDVGATSAETSTGGVRINLIPKDGGNSFKGTVFAGGENSSMQANNFTQDLQNRGLLAVDSIKYGYDINPGFGGPIRKDSLWFYVGVRKDAQHNYVGGTFADLNAGDPTKFTYRPDLNQQMIFPQDFWGENIRLTWQANQKNKFSAYYDNQYRCQCPRMTGTSTYEASPPFRVPLQRTASLSWSAPVTSRLLLEAAVGERGERWRHTPLPDEPAGGAAFRYLPGITEQSPVGTAIATYRNQSANANDQLLTYWNLRASLSYITGSHAFKVGMTDLIAKDDIYAWNFNMGTVGNPAAVSYRFNGGKPNQITEFARPYEYITNQPADLGIFAQDKWTSGKLTAQLGVRYEYFKTSFPAQSVGPALLTPNRNVSFPESSWASLNDIMPRLGLAYDLRGDGKTALKVSLNKYTIQQSIAGTYGTTGNPINLLATSVTRTWTDNGANGGVANDFIPQCDLVNVNANGECGKVSDTNFGNATKTTAFDPNVLTGWGHRPYNWEFSASVQQELAARVSLNVGYFRRWYGNFTVQDNLAVAATDFSSFYVVAPIDNRLPGGGGYTVSGLLDTNPTNSAGQSLVGAVNNLVSLSDTYGNQVEHWNGIDASVVARLQHGIIAQGGLSTGRTITDNCEIFAKVPEAGVPGFTNQLGGPYCHQNSGFLTQVKLLAAYTLPKVDVQISGTFQSIPGPLVTASQVIPAASITGQLGRPLFGGAANATVNLVNPGDMYGERLNQLDLRFSKVFRYGATRTALNFDVYNATNASTVQVQSNSYSNWQTPQRIILARFLKISANFDF